MGEDYFFYHFNRGRRDLIEVEDILELGNRLTLTKRFLENKFPSFKGEFGADFYDEDVSLRFWSLGLMERSFYEKLFEYAGYPFRAETSKKIGELLSKILKESNVPFKKSGIFKKTFKFN